MLRELSGQMGIRGDISLLQSDLCRVPFTYGVFRPLVFFPSDLGEWPKEHARAVLRHELVHIKQKDYAVKLFARYMCSLFWFIPFVWVAYANLCAEQEHACDAAIVEGGENPARYARELICIARAAREQLLATCIFVSKQKRNLLKKRVCNILELKGVKKINGIYVPEAIEEFYCTWVNMKHTGVPM